MQDLMDWKDVIYFQHFKASWFYSFTHSIVYSHAAMHVPKQSAQDHIVQCRRQRTTACLVLIALLELLSAGNDKWVFVRTSHIPQDLLALLQILLISAAKKLKTHCCPLSVFPLLAYRRDLTKRKKLVHMTSCSLAATLSVSGHCLLLVSYCRLFTLDISTTFLHFADENSALGTESLIIRPHLSLFSAFFLMLTHTIPFRLSS